MGNEQGRVLSAEELRQRDISQMDNEMKRKFQATGSRKYNIKIVVKGDRNTGKTSLWRRLQGMPFLDEYVPTPEIQTCHINWNYKVSDDVVKVEVWDVVDKARARKQSSALKMSQADEPDTDNASKIIAAQSEIKKGSFSINQLDAETFDVLQGAHAVIVMFDPTKKWTWDYVTREVPKIPQELYTLVLANYRDMGEHRVITEYEVKEYCKNAGPHVKSLEVSMLDGYGLKSVVTFFNIPFLYMQRVHIQQQLNRNSEEIESAEDELKLISKEQSYEFYRKWLEQSQKDKAAGRKPAPAPTAQPPAAAPPVTEVKPAPQQAQQRPPTAAQPTAAPQQKPAAQQATPSQPAAADPKKNPPTSTPPKEQQQPAAPAPVPAPAPAEPAPKTSFFSKFAKAISSKEDKKEPPKQIQKTPSAAALTVPKSVDEFVPGDLDDGFFDDEDRPGKSPPKQQSKPQASQPQKPDVDDDDDDYNPMVAKDEDFDEEIPVKKVAPPVVRKTAPVVEKPKPAPKAQPVTPASPPPVAVVSPRVSQDNTIQTFSAGAANLPTSDDDDGPIEQYDGFPGDSDDDQPNPMLATDDDDPFQNPDHMLPSTRKASKPKAMDPQTAISTPKAAPAVTAKPPAKAAVSPPTKPLKASVALDSDSDDDKPNPALLADEEPDFSDIKPVSKPSSKPSPKPSPVVPKASSPVVKPAPAPVKQLPPAAAAESDEEDKPNPLVEEESPEFDSLPEPAPEPVPEPVRRAPEESRRGRGERGRRRGDGERRPRPPGERPQRRPVDSNEEEPTRPRPAGSRKKPAAAKVEAQDEDPFGDSKSALDAFLDD